MARGATRSQITKGAVPAERLAAPFPRIALPIHPPFPPMEAKLVPEIPGGAWLYEPKWDGFRCLAFRRGNRVLLQSKSGQPLTRYFPEIEEALLALPTERFALDGEIVIADGGRLDFDALLQRIHPAASRIRRLAQETPATYMVFDLLVDEHGKALVGLALSERRPLLEKLFQHMRYTGRVRLSPATRHHDEAERWMRHLGPSGLDGVIAKKLDEPYHSGDRRGMEKIKRIRTADCVVGGFRWTQKGGEVGSLLLGLYNESGKLDHVGFTASFTAEQRKELKKVLEPLRGAPGFSGNAPGGPSRWTTRRSADWEPLNPKLVCEVQYDHFSGGRFRHGTKFLRWRPDKSPKQCRFDQVRPSRAGKGLVEFGLSAA